MFIAMNRFSVAQGREKEFEDGWRNRNSRLDEFPGFVQFALLKCDDQGEYISHTTWRAREDFLAWTGSDAFREAHSQRLPEGVLTEHPRAKFYDSVLVETAEAAAP